MCQIVNGKLKIEVNGRFRWEPIKVCQLNNCEIIYIFNICSIARWSKWPSLGVGPNAVPPPLHRFWLTMLINVDIK